MKKGCAILIFIFTLLASIYAQEVEKKTTSYDQFISQSGKIIRFLDYKLPALKGSYEIYENKIRVLNAGDKTTYYLQISKKGKYGEATGSINEIDLGEMVKAIDSLLVTYANDATKKFDYMENKFITDDGVEIGYYFSGKDTSWYIVLGKYKTDASCFFYNGDLLKNAFNLAQNKIAEVKRTNE
jgi:hypothetical protein